jgi:hypothetical protein
VKKAIGFLFFAAVLAFAGPASAVICTIDQVPSATLLAPYFEVDLDDANGVTTLIAINNASATAILVHVVLWTDLSVETFDFNIYLTGYDVQTINLRDIFNGTVPRTASAGQDPTDTISNKGIFSQDINFASCTGQLPPPPIPAPLLDHIRRAHTGQASPVFQNRCSALDYGDNIARGYITMDTVNNCTLQAVGTTNTPYFSSSVTFQNVLWGDVIYVNPGQNFAQGESLVNIEASLTDPEVTVPGEYTFYGRYVNWLATDRREPLSTNFASRFVTGGAFTGGTDLLCWRDSKVVQGPFTCPVVPGVRPAWFPLGQEGLVIFDEEENPEVPQQFPFSPPLQDDAITPCPAETQRTEVDGPDFPVTPSVGWLYLNLNTTVAAAGANPPEDPAAAQAWVTTVMDADGRFSVGFDATQLDSACNALHFTPGG